MSRLLDAMGEIRDVLSSEELHQEFQSIPHLTFDSKVFNKEVCQQVLDLSGVEMSSMAGAAVVSETTFSPLLTEWGIELRRLASDLYQMVGGTVPDSERAGSRAHRDYQAITDAFDGKHQFMQLNHIAN